MTPVTEDPRRTRRRLYRVADNFLAFWLGVVDRHRAAIERGLGSSVLPVMLVELDDHLGIPWEEAVRIHLRRLAAAGELGPDVVAVGRYWTATQPPVEIDGVVLAGRSRTAVAVAEAKWARRVDGAAVARGLCSSGSRLPSSSSSASREAALRASRSSVSSSEGGGSGTIRSSHPERLSPPSRVHGHDVLVRRVEAERPRDAFTRRLRLGRHAQGSSGDCPVGLASRRAADDELDAIESPRRRPRRDLVSAALGPPTAWGLTMRSVRVHQLRHHTKPYRPIPCSVLGRFDFRNGVLRDTDRRLTGSEAVRARFPFPFLGVLTSVIYATSLLEWSSTSRWSDEHGPRRERPPRPRRRHRAGTGEGFPPSSSTRSNDCVSCRTTNR